MSRSQVEEAAHAVRERLPENPRVAIVLGSGLSDFSDNLSQPVTIPYSEIPHYPELTVPGHVGKLVFGWVDSLPVLVARGRFHYYEEHPLEIVTLPVRLFAHLGVEILIITNAAGCANPRWNEGDLMLITGHLDYTFIDSPADPTLVSGEPFHSQELLALAREAAGEADIPVRQGIYAWCLGPTFETPAEIKEISALGGHAAGMSTVPEIRAAAEEGLQILGISCLTNYAAGIRDTPLNHEEVLATGQRVKAAFARLVLGILKKISS
ncbi:MAG: purine-nucleoside phosphorylase [Fidelibacterota bacterium]|nr:MAG: purine-nucleoside phosphorylase [Candidatus Neomarinimicrobiota bacterium]